MSEFKQTVNEEIQLRLESNSFVVLNDSPKIFKYLHKHWRSNFEPIGFEDLVDKAFDAVKNLNSGSLKDYKTVFQNELLTPEFKKHRRKTYASESKMSFQYKLVEPYLAGTKSMMDYGCGKLALLRKISYENNDLDRLIGFDPSSAPRFISNDSRVVFIDDFAKLSQVKDVDVVYSSFVFHHLTKEQIQEAINAVKKVLRPNGKFIFIEESFPTSQYNLFEKSNLELNEIGYEIDKELVEKFMNLNVEERFIAIYINDFLINLNNLDYMPWTFEYRDIESWIQIFKSNGFKLSEEYFFGIIKNKGLKQGITVMMVFEKSTA